MSVTERTFFLRGVGCQIIYFFVVDTIRAESCQTKLMRHNNQTIKFPQLRHRSVSARRGSVDVTCHRMIDSSISLFLHDVLHCFKSSCNKQLNTQIFNYLPYVT